MKVGFTGTREGLTNKQMAWLVTTLEDGSITEVHHGACVGADASVHALALECGLNIHVWPPVNPKFLAAECVRLDVRHGHSDITIHAAMPYLDRNREIVGATAGLVGLPKQDVQPDKMNWGGTWYTVDFAERMNKPVTICHPNGIVEQRFPLGWNGVP